MRTRPTLSRVVRVLTCLVILSATILAGCKPTPKLVELTIWHQENTNEAVPVFEKMVNNFNASHPNIKVTIQANDWDGFYEKFSSALAAGKAPEIVFTIPDYTITMRQSGKIYPVDDLFKELDAKHKFFDGMVTPYNYDGHMWAIPVYGMDHGLWYRKDVFEANNIAVPKTWDEMLAAAKTLTRDGKYGFALGGSKHMWTSQNLYDLMITNNAQDIFDANGKVAFDNPRTVQTLAFYKELWTCCSPPDSTGWGFAEPVPTFLNGTTSMMMHMGHIILFWADGTGLPPDQLGWAPIPWPADGQRGSIAYSNGLMITTEDPAKLAAIKTFMEWLYEPDNTGAFLAELTPGLFLPVTEDAAASQAFWANPTIAMYKDIVTQVIDNLKYGALYGFTSGTPNENIGAISGQQILAQVVQKLIIDNATPEEAAAWGQARMEEAVGQ